MASLVVTHLRYPNGDSRFFEERLLFPLQDKHVHSSSLVECPNGDLLCCWFHGSGERQSPDVVVQGARLKHGAEAWSDVFLMADTPGFPDCNPVLFVDGQGELWLFRIVVMAERWEDSLLRFRKSRDYQGDGPPNWFWQDDILLKPGDEFADAVAKGLDELDAPGLHYDFGAYVPAPSEVLVETAKDMSKRQRGWMTRTHALVLPSGRLLLPLYSDGFYLGLMAISDDHGETWRASSPIVGAGLNQPSVVRKRDGTVVAYMREEGPMLRRVQRSVSTDEGETWSVAAATDLPNPNSSLEVIALRDGRWVMVHNDSEHTRDTLAVSLSDDEGSTWRWTRHLEQEEGGQFHYPSVVQTQDGRVHVTYTYQPSTGVGKSIKHVAFEAEWIVAGD